MLGQNLAYGTHLLPLNPFCVQSDVLDLTRVVIHGCHVLMGPGKLAAFPPLRPLSVTRQIKANNQTVFGGNNITRRTNHKNQKTDKTGCSRAFSLPGVAPADTARDQPLIWRPRLLLNTCDCRRIIYRGIKYHCWVIVGSILESIGDVICTLAVPKWEK